MFRSLLQFRSILSERTQKNWRKCSLATPMRIWSNIMLIFERWNNAPRRWMQSSRCSMSDGNTTVHQVPREKASSGNTRETWTTSGTNMISKFSASSRMLGQTETSKSIFQLRTTQCHTSSTSSTWSKHENPVVQSNKFVELLKQSIHWRNCKVQWVNSPRPWIKAGWLPAECRSTRTDGALKAITCNINKCCRLQRRSSTVSMMQHLKLAVQSRRRFHIRGNMRQCQEYHRAAKKLQNHRSQQNRAGLVKRRRRQISRGKFSTTSTFSLTIITVIKENQHRRTKKASCWATPAIKHPRKCSVKTRTEVLRCWI